LASLFRAECSSSCAARSILILLAATELLNDVAVYVAWAFTTLVRKIRRDTSHPSSVSMVRPFMKAISFVRLRSAAAAGEIDRQMADYKLLRNLPRCRHSCFLSSNKTASQSFLLLFVLLINETSAGSALVEPVGLGGTTGSNFATASFALARADRRRPRNYLVGTGGDIVGRIDVLVIDDWAMAPLSEQERRDFWEICEDRCQVRSTVLTSQLPVSRWHEQIGDPTLADGILDRLVHNAHRIEMRGDSMRKNRGKPNA